MLQRLFFLSIILFSNVTYSNNIAEWGPTGHRTVGGIAQLYLNEEAAKMVDELLDGDSLALVSTFADEIKSDDRFYEISPWHYVNFPFDTTYEAHSKSDKGDIVVAIQKCMDKLSDSNASKEDKAFYLKLLVHFVGDLHQPLHIGKADDRGGNDFQVRWFDEGTNLHSVWDEKIITQFGMSYSELVENRKVLTPEEIKDIQSGTLNDWMYESRNMCLDIYEHTEVGEKLSYRYMYRYAHPVRNQLHKGGLRLAALLNKVFTK